MTLLAAAVVPAAPLLVPELAGGSAALDEQLRSRVRAAVRDLLAGPGDLVVVGSAPTTGPVTGTWDWSGFGVARRGGDGPGLPLALAVGAWLLDEVDPALPRELVGVAGSADPAACAALGARLAADRPVRLLVVGDGSACRTEKAPGHLDPRAEAFDLAAERALRDGSPDGLLALDPGLAGELLCAGRAPWQVLAGAAAGGPWQARVTHAEAPYGVAYLVASWSRPG